MARETARRPAARGHVPLARALSKLGLASRSEAIRLVTAGRVTLDGQPVLDPRALVVPERVRIGIDGVERPVGKPARRVIALHKPRGTVTTTRDPEGRRTVFDILGDAGRGLIAVGRLDYASTGLLLFTNDAALASALTDPGRRVIRRYVVTVRGRVPPEAAVRLREGLDLPRARGGQERLQADRVSIRKASGRETHLVIELTEGRNREIRRLFAALGHEVTRLHRVAYGTIALGDLPPGGWREIDAAATESLARGVAASVPRRATPDTAARPRARSGASGSAGGDGRARGG